jgi:hypothetical protein
VITRDGQDIGQVLHRRGDAAEHGHVLVVLAVEDGMALILCGPRVIVHPLHDRAIDRTLHGLLLVTVHASIVSAPSSLPRC